MFTRIGSAAGFRRRALTVLVAGAAAGVMVLPVDARPGPAASSSSTALAYIKMVSPAMGWALGPPGLLRTADGGRSWTVVRRRPGGQPRQSYALYGPYFLATYGRDDAWAMDGTVRTQGRPAFAISATFDGGRTWKTWPQLYTKRLSGYAATLDGFANRRRGWATVEQGAGAGNVWTELGRTSNGGRSWIRVESNSGTDPGKHDLPSCSGMQNITFRTWSDGFATGQCFASTGYIYYQSSDGGVTWYPHSLHRPASRGIRGFYAGVTEAPVFAGTHGIMLMGFGNPARLVTYRTSNGGRSWKPTNPVALGMRFTVNGLALDYSAVAPSDIWALAATGLVGTTNAGRSWTRLALPPDAVQHSRHAVVEGGIKNPPLQPDIDFVNSSHGFLLEASGGLYRTTNGGKTWSREGYRLKG